MAMSWATHELDVSIPAAGRDTWALGRALEQMLGRNARIGLGLGYRDLEFAAASEEEARRLEHRVRAFIDARGVPGVVYRVHPVSFR